MNPAFDDGQFIDLFGDLYGEFTRWTKNDCLYCAILWIHELNSWNRKRRRLTGTSLRLAYHIMSGHDQRNRFGLNWGRLFVAEATYRLQQSVRKAEISE